MPMPKKGGILTCHIEDIDRLYASYLPFVNNGAIFIPSQRPQELGSDVFVAITLPGSNERLPLNGKVIWINQKTSSHRPVGFAVQLGADEVGLRLKNEIEKRLAGKLEAIQSTYTM